jgi:hypothetical protein
MLEQHKLGFLDVFVAINHFHPHRSLLGQGQEPTSKSGVL